MTENKPETYHQKGQSGISHMSGGEIKGNAKVAGVIYEKGVVINNQPSSCSSSTKPSFFALDDKWVGRDELVAELSSKVRDSSRLLILVGISGIGKTALAEKLAVELYQEFLQGNWRNFQQENLENDGKSRDFRSVATRWLQKWGEALNEEDYKNTERLLRRLVNRLEQERYLVIIDSLENILVGNENEGWSDFQDKWWLEFFKQFLASSECQSRIILTSQDLPEIISERYEKFCESKPLTGLKYLEQLQLFEKTGLDVDNDSFNQRLQRIGKAYEGHPLALRVIAGEIVNKPFNGNVTAYWSKYGNEIEEVEKAIEEAKTKGIIASADDKFQLDRYTRQLRKKVRERLDKTFGRLYEEALNAYRLICENAIYRCEVQESFWWSHLEDWDCNENEAKVALQTLRDRFLVEEMGVNESGEFFLRQHNLIRSVSLENQKKMDKEDG